MPDRGSGRGRVNGFVPMRVVDAVAALRTDCVHVWRVPYVRRQGRDPLRRLLAAYLGVDAAVVHMVEGAHGRPALAHARGLDFNWSHSGDHAVIAVARELPELGVDIERWRERNRVLELAQRHFHPDEAHWLATLSGPRRMHGFLALWTAKEAVLKAMGRGLGYGLARVSFVEIDGTLHAGQFDGEAGPAAQWQVCALPVAPDLCGAVAWRGAPRRVTCFLEPGADTSAPPPD